MRSTHTSAHLADSPAEPAPGSPVESTAGGRRPAAPVVAGVVLGVVGLANVVVGVLAAVTGLVRLTPATAGTLAVLGLVTVALGVLVARRVRWATVLALVVFVGLFVTQAAAGGDAAGPAPALVTLAVVIAPLVLALRSARLNED